MRRKDLRNRQPPPYNLLHFNREKLSSLFKNTGRFSEIVPCFSMPFGHVEKAGNGHFLAHAYTRRAPQVVSFCCLHPSPTNTSTWYSIHCRWTKGAFLPSPRVNTKGWSLHTHHSIPQQVRGKRWSGEGKNRKTPDARVYTRTREGAIFSGSSDIWGDGCRKEENRWANCRFPCV